MPFSGMPSTSTRPDDGASNPAATFNNVVLPQPVGPTTETNSPSQTESDASLTATYRPAPLRAAKAQETRSYASAGTIVVASIARLNALLVFLRSFLLERHVESLRQIDGRRLNLGIEAFQIAIDRLRRLDADRPVVFVRLQ